MNKYKQAFNVIINRLYKSHITITCNYTDEETLIEEIVNKSIPMKPFSSTWGYCCSGEDCLTDINFEDNFCKKCGQAIDWSKE